MQIDSSQRDTSSNVNMIALIIGILLLLPLTITIIQNQLVPAIQVFQTAQTDGNPISTPKFVGMENYKRLQEDPNIANALGYTLSIVLSRVAIVSVIPLIFGILAGMQSRFGRILNRTLLSLLAGLIVPIALTVLWQVYMGQMWGKEPSPIFNRDTSLASPDGARASINTLDSMITLAIALIVGGSCYMAAMRSARKWLSVLAIWLVGVLIAAGSGFLVFDMPLLLTGGGPARSTTTLMLYIYQSGFQQFRIGYSSTIASFMIPGAILIGFLIWLIVTVFNLRASYTSRDNTPRQKSFFSLLSIPLLILVAFSIINLVLWAYGLISANNGFSQLAENPDLKLGQIAIDPLTTIWLIHLPITYLGALSLGFLRPLGKIGSNLLFLLLFVISLIPMESLMFEWYMQARAAGIINTPAVLGLPWVVNGFSLLVLKLFFDGTVEAYQRAIAEGKSAQDAFLRQVILPTLPIAILIGAVLSFISTQSMLWAFITQNSPENWTPPVALVAFMGQYATQNISALAAAYNMLTSLFLPFVILVAIIQIFVLDRVVIQAGKSLEKSKGVMELEAETSFESDLIQAKA